VPVQAGPCREKETPHFLRKASAKELGQGFPVASKPPGRSAYLRQSAFNFTKLTGAQRCSIAEAAAFAALNSR
jgi:hypothetical protein